MRKQSMHPIRMKSTLYVSVPYYLADEQGINEGSKVSYQREGKGIVIRIGETN